MQIKDASLLLRFGVMAPSREGKMANPDPAIPSEHAIRPRGRAKPDISSWPIRAAYLRALSDLGLTDVKIADYLKVDTEEVTSLRIRYRIAEGHWKSLTPVRATLRTLSYTSK
jgi:hypothetical protein